MKQKTHCFIIKVRMDKKCTAAVALRELRNCIHGEFYCTKINDDDPETFKLSRIARVPKGDQQ